MIHTAINGSETRAMYDEAIEIQRGAVEALALAEKYWVEAQQAEKAAAEALQRAKVASIKAFGDSQGAQKFLKKATARAEKLRSNLEQLQPSLATIDKWAEEWKQTAGMSDCDSLREYALENRLTLQQLIDYEAYLMSISSVQVPAPRQTVPLLAISIIFKLKDLEPLDSGDSIDCGF